MPDKTPATFTIRNWRKYQRYSDRKPLWFCVYTSIKDDLDYEAAKRGLDPVTDTEIGQIIGIFAMATKHDDPHKMPNGPELPANPAWIKKQAKLDDEPDLERLANLCVISCNSLLQILPLEQGVFVAQRTEQNSTEQNSKIKSGKPDVVAKNQNIKKHAQEVLEFLIEITGRGFSNTKIIEACIKREKCTVSDCKRMLRYKMDEWKGTKMETHIDPITPFRPSKFSGYLDQALAGPVRTNEAPKEKTFEQRLEEDLERNY